MKIGILTYPLNNNYGCYLQSYALLNFLKDNGFDVEYIFRRHNKPSVAFYIRYALSMLVKNILNRKWNSILLNYEWYYMRRKGYKMYPFFEKYIIPHTQPIYTTYDLKKQCLIYDTIIVGSDQIWRAGILSNIEDYFLTFLGNKSIRRIAYAASFGKDNPGYTEVQKQSCGQALSKFHAVSVREDVGLRIIKDYKWICPPCQVVLDPTLLLTKDTYLSLIKKNDNPITVFGYFLDQSIEKISTLHKVAEKVNVEPYNILRETYNNDFVYPPVEQWLGSLSSSRFVVTDSFHGMVFSIIFNKPFVVIVNRDRGAARFTSLLKMLNLEDRILESIEELDRIMNKDIDWKIINSNLDCERKRSIDFLLKSIRS